MKLETVKGLGTPTANRLRRRGVRSVEQLAALNVRKTTVPGLPPARLAALKRRAQVTLFQSAVRRVERIGSDTVERFEGFLRNTTRTALHAAQAAQERARVAVGAARSETRTLARVATTRAHQAARKAELEYRKLSRKLARAPPKVRSRLAPYRRQAQRAAAAAVRATAAAREALVAAERRAEALARREAAGLAERLRRLDGAAAARRNRRDGGVRAPGRRARSPSGRAGA